MPFVTEAIFEQLPSEETTLVTAAYPVVNPALNNAEAAQGVEYLKELIVKIRNARAEVNVAPSKPITILVKTKDASVEAFFKANENYIKRFANPEKLEIGADVVAPEAAMSQVITGAEIYLPLADLLNVEEELKRLDKELAKWQKEVDMVERKLGNEKFVANAKPEVVEKERAKLVGHQEKLAAVQAQVDNLKKL
jgi:valyl-tRNA synthetase